MDDNNQPSEREAWDFPNLTPEQIYEAIEYVRNCLIRWRPGDLTMESLAILLDEYDRIEEAYQDLLRAIDEIKKGKTTLILGEEDRESPLRYVGDETLVKWARYTIHLVDNIYHQLPDEIGARQGIESAIMHAGISLAVAAWLNGDKQQQHDLGYVNYGDQVIGKVKIEVTIDSNMR